MRNRIANTCAGAIVALIFSVGLSGATFGALTLTTLTVPAITTTSSALALAGVGALGAGAALGLLGVAAKSRSRSSRRRGRSVGDSLASPIVISTNHNKETGEDTVVLGLEPTFRSLELLDDSDCAKLHLCKVSANSEFANDEEKELLSLFTDEISLASSKSVFDLAVRLGQIGKSLQMCEERYFKCKPAEKEE